MSKHNKVVPEGDYTTLLHLAVTEIRTARQFIATQLNSIATSVYWNLGKLLSDRQIEEGYGSSVVKQLSADLKTEFPDMGVSPRNLWNMKRFYERYHVADEKLRQAVAVLPWGHNLGFLGISEPLREKELENRLVAKIRNFILELGKGFSFIGNQYRLEFNGKEYFVDMLFFHRGLRALVAVELKIGSFKPEYAGKMNFYLSLLDKLEKGENENQSIGIMLCADKDHLDVEIALQDINKPIGVAEYQLLLPKDALQTLILNEIKADIEEHE